MATTTTSYLSQLYLITFLDSLNLGLIMPVLTPHLLSIGGSHTTCGLLVSLHCIAQLLATANVRGLFHRYGKREALIFTLTIAVISHFILAFTAQFWIVFIARLAFYLTNQSQTVVKSYVLSTEPTDRHDIIDGVIGALGVSGYLVGPIIGGYMFGWSNGFAFISILAASTAFTSIFLALLLPIQPGDPENVPSLVHYITDNLTASLTVAKKKLDKANIECNWNIYLLRIMVTTSLTTFFMKFSMLLKFHYDADSVVIGYTVAYQSMLLFLMNFILAKVERQLSTDPATRLVQILSTALVSIATVCYALSYEMYLLLFIPLAMSRLLLDTMWPGVIYAGRGRELSEAAGVVATVTSIAVPLILGLFCDMFSHQAVKFFSIMPLVVAILVCLKTFEAPSGQTANVAGSASFTSSDIPMPGTNAAN